MSVTPLRRAEVPRRWSRRRSSRTNHQRLGMGVARRCRPQPARSDSKNLGIVWTPGLQCRRGGTSGRWRTLLMVVSSLAWLLYSTMSQFIVWSMADRERPLRHLRLSRITQPRSDRPANCPVNWAHKASLAILHGCLPSRMTRRADTEPMDLGSVDCVALAYGHRMAKLARSGGSAIPKIPALRLSRLPSSQGLRAVRPSNGILPTFRPKAKASVLLAF